MIFSLTARRCMMKRSKSGRGILLLVMILVLGLGPGSAAAKSLYVNADLNANSPIKAYDIQGSTLVYQQTSNTTGYGGAGLAIDTDSETLFVTFEGSGALKVVDAKTLVVPATYVTAPGASNLAGIVMDQDNQMLYAIDRGTSHLYVYSWDAINKTLQNLVTTAPYYVNLANIGGRGAHGIALDEIHDRLYVGDVSFGIKVYDTATWNHVQTIALTSQEAMGVAVDSARGFVYSGNAYHGYGGNGTLSQYNLLTGVETTIDIRTITQSTNDCVVGLAVDPDTGYVYITTGNQATGGSDRIMVFDSSLTLLFQTGDIGNPTGIVVPGKDISYNPLNLAKEDGLDYDMGECVVAGGLITYTISFDNTNDYSVGNVTLTDPVPGGTGFWSASDGGTESGGIVSWFIGTVPANTSGSVTLVLDVDPNAMPGSDISNNATIDSDQTPPTTQGDKTLVCPNQPPDADAGPDQTVEQSSSAGTPVILDGSGSSDPDGDPLTFTWTGPFGTATGISPTVTLPLGSHIISLTVFDGQATDSDTVMITVVDTTPPDLTVPADVTVEQESAAGTVVPLSATATDICDADVDITDNQMAIYPLGVTVVTFTATDDSGNVSSKTVTVTVVDTTPPVLTVNPSMAELWPPNHKYVDITLGVTVTDVCDADVADKVQLVSVTSDEPEDVMGANNKKNGGDGNTVNDIVIVDQNTLQLRAERLGGSDGRVYTINFMVTDASGNTTTAAATVSVRHNPEIPAVDSGVSYTVTP